MNDLKVNTEIKDNLERELFLKYTTDLRELNTDFKKDLMITFIKKELFSINKNFKDLWENWLMIVENLNTENNSDKEQLELIFLHSILKTNGFRNFCKQNLKLKNGE